MPEEDVRVELFCDGVESFDASIFTDANGEATAATDEGEGVGSFCDPGQELRVTVSYMGASADCFWNVVAGSEFSLTCVGTPSNGSVVPADQPVSVLGTVTPNPGAGEQITAQIFCNNVPTGPPFSGPVTDANGQFSDTGTLGEEGGCGVGEEFRIRFSYMGASANCFWTVDPPVQGFSCIGGSALYEMNEANIRAHLDFGNSDPSCTIGAQDALNGFGAEEALSWFKVGEPGNDSNVAIGLGDNWVTGTTTFNVSPGTYTDTVQRSPTASINPNTSYQITYTITVSTASAILRVTIDNIVQL